MVKLSPFIASAFLFSAQSSMAFEESDFRNSFDKQEGCFVVLDLSDGKVFQEYNEKRCAERFAPQSSFKIAAALMAFEKGVLKNENQVLPLRANQKIAFIGPFVKDQHQQLAEWRGAGN